MQRALHRVHVDRVEHANNQHRAQRQVKGVKQLGGDAKQYQGQPHKNAAPDDQHPPVAHVFAGAQPQVGQQRPRAANSVQDAEPLGSYSQHVFGKHRQQQNIGDAKEAVEEGHRDQKGEDGVLANEGQPLQDVSTGVAPDYAGQGRYLEPVDNGGHDEESQPRQVKGRGGSGEIGGQADDESGDGRGDNPGALPDGGVQSHRADHRLAFDQLGIEGHASGHVEGVHRSGQKGDNQHVPAVHLAHNGQGRQQEQQSGGQGLGDDDYPALVQPVGEHAAE